MRKLVLGVLVAASVMSSAGCIIPIYSSDPTRRMHQLLNTSENLRNVHEEWERAWLIDQPCHMTRTRVDGSF